MDWLAGISVLVVGLLLGIFIGILVEGVEFRQRAVAQNCAHYVVGENGATEFRWKAK